MSLTFLISIFMCGASTFETNETEDDDIIEMSFDEFVADPQVDVADVVATADVVVVPPALPLCSINAVLEEVEPNPSFLVHHDVSDVDRDDDNDDHSSAFFVIVESDSEDTFDELLSEVVEETSVPECVNTSGPAGLLNSRSCKERDGRISDLEEQLFAAQKTLDILAKKRLVEEEKQKKEQEAAAKNYLKQLEELQAALDVSERIREQVEGMRSELHVKFLDLENELKAQTEAYVQVKKELRATQEQVQHSQALRCSCR